MLITTLVIISWSVHNLSTTSIQIYMFYLRCFLSKHDLLETVWYFQHGIQYYSLVTCYCQRDCVYLPRHVILHIVLLALRKKTTYFQIRSQSCDSNQHLGNPILSWWLYFFSTILSGEQIEANIYEDKTLLKFTSFQKII